ncbi:hypothetical protein O3M35_010879 [Rhynocoris fuscipes]|uniref:H15 domain-containing protein n=1 Tax=Rhynocoris fuscipes TaxID=488301 RepID=A0AAW1D624_9HEMI
MDELTCPAENCEKKYQPKTTLISPSQTTRKVIRRSQMLKLVKSMLKNCDIDSGLGINEMLKYISDHENVEKTSALPRLLDVLDNAEEQGILQNVGNNKYALADDYENFCGTCGRWKRTMCSTKRRSRRKRVGGCGGKRRRRSGVRRGRRRGRSGCGGRRRRGRSRRGGRRRRGRSGCGGRRRGRRSGSRRRGRRRGGCGDEYKLRWEEVRNISIYNTRE